jgi:hypothetical protein
LSPPISTLSSGLRACWRNWRGAVAWIRARHMPGSKRTRSPRTSQPASRQISSGLAPDLQHLRVVAELHADFSKYRLGVGLDQAQALVVEQPVGADLALDIG